MRKKNQVIFRHLLSWHKRTFGEKKNWKKKVTRLCILKQITSIHSSCFGSDTFVFYHRPEVKFTCSAASCSRLTAVTYRCSELLFAGRSDPGHPAVISHEEHLELFTDSVIFIVSIHNIY